MPVVFLSGWFLLKDTVKYGFEQSSRGFFKLSGLKTDCI